MKHEGDPGTTSFLGKGRLSKSELRFEVLGALDETQAALGIARASANNQGNVDLLYKLQKAIPLAMAEAAADFENVKKFEIITSKHVAWLDDEIERLEQKGIKPDGFLIPGESQPGAFLDLARTIARRAERQLVRLSESGAINNPNLLAFFNRLSLLLFYLEIVEEKSR